MQQELKIVVKADGTAQVVGNLNKVNTALTGVQTKAGLVGTAMGSAIKTMLGFGSAILVAGTAFKVAGQALSNFNQQVMALKEVQAVLNSTGRAADFTAQSLNQMASQFMKVSNYGDDEIMQGAILSLLRFDSISKETFPRVLTAVVNTAKSFGGLEAAAKNLGIAMNDPVLGMSRMRKGGVDFSASQKATIKSLMETGDLLGAQSILLTAVESKWGEAALAGATASGQLKVAWGEYLEALGGTLSVVDGIKKGMSTFFLGVANESKNLSDEQIKHVYDVQQQWAKSTSFIMNLIPTTFKVIGTGLATVGLSLYNAGKIFVDIIKATSTTISRAWLDLAIFMVKNNPIAQAANSMEWLSKKLGIAIDFSYVNDKVISGLETLKKGIADNTDFGDVKNDVDNMANTILDGVNRMSAAVQKAGTNYSTATQDIKDFYEAQKKLIGTGTMPAVTPDETGTNAGASGVSGNVAAMAQAAQDYYNRIMGLNDSEMQAAIKKYAELRMEAEAFYAQGLITGEQHTAAIIEIKNSETSELQGIADKQAEIVRKQVTDEMAMQSQAAEIAKQLNNDKLSAQLAYLQATQPLSEAALNAQLDAYRREIEAYTELGLTKIQIDEMVAAKRKELSEKGSQATVKDYLNLTGQLSNIVNGFASIAADAKAKEMAAIDEVADREKWSNDKRMAMKQDITNKFEAEEKRLKNIQKVMSMTSSVINTAEGITKALSLGPTGIPLAVLIGALGAVEIGVIAAQNFARGGLFRGIGGETDDQNLVRLSNNEYVVNAAATRQYKPVLDAINYGYKNIGKGYSGGYSDGGLVMPTQRNNYDMDYMRAVNDNITGLRNDLRTTGLELKGSDGVPLMKFVKRAETNYRTV